MHTISIKEHRVAGNILKFTSIKLFLWGWRDDWEDGSSVPSIHIVAIAFHISSFRSDYLF